MLKKMLTKAAWIIHERLQTLDTVMYTEVFDRLEERLTYFAVMGVLEQFPYLAIASVHKKIQNTEVIPIQGGNIDMLIGASPYKEPLLVTATCFIPAMDAPEHSNELLVIDITFSDSLWDTFCHIIL